MNKAKLVIFFTFLIFIAPNSYAEGCKSDFSLYTGCKGEEGYIYIPKAYKQKSSNPLCSGKYQIFKGDKLPKVGSTVKPLHNTKLIFYKSLDEIDKGYKICDLDAKAFKRKDLFGRNEQEANECLIGICMTYFEKQNNYVTGNENILGELNQIKIISYEQIKNDLFAKIKVTK